MRNKLRVFMMLVIAGLLGAAFFTWQPAEPEENVDPNNPEYKLMYALDKLSEKVPDLKGELDEFGAALKGKLSEARETASVFNFDMLNIFDAKEKEEVDEMSVDDLKKLLETAEGDIGKLNDSGLSEKLKRLLESVKQKKAEETKDIE